MKNTVGARARSTKQFTHELLNQLSVIVGNCQLLSEKTPSDPDCARYVQRISETARLMALTVQNAHGGKPHKARKLPQ